MTNNGSEVLLPQGRNSAISALTADVPLEPVEASQVAHGSPQHGATELGELGDCTVGIWELREGGMTDTEVDELFVVVSGEATVEFLGTVSGEVTKTVRIRTGDVMRLIAGSRTRWTVSDHIRKVYLST